MRSLLRPFLSAFILAGLGACFVDLDDRPGRSCNEQQPCTAPRECIAGRCFAPDEAPPPSDGGADAGRGGGSAGGASGGTAGGSAGGGMAGGSAGGVAGGAAGGSAGGAAGGSAGGAAVDAGRPPVWQQPVHGFTEFTQDTGCTAMVDAANGNQLNASVANAADDQDSASGDFLDGGFLPQQLEGAVRGRVRLNARPALTGNLPFVEYSLGRNMNIHLQLAITAQNALQVSSQANTVADLAVTNTYAVDGGFAPGDYLFEVRWRRNGTRRVWLNNQLLGTVNLPAAGAAPQVPDRFRIGIMRLDGMDGGATSLSMRSWQLGDREDTTFGNLP
ncbi:MAG: hypothetical protein SFW67_33145 [Myxococcaceae bacterium]|nr:hypothetical protein [Myxococcaceae bacterium]